MKIKFEKPESVVDKWEKVLDHPALVPIHDLKQRESLARNLEDHTELVNERYLSDEFFEYVQKEVIDKYGRPRKNNG